MNGIQELTPRQIVRESLVITSEICIYTNSDIVVEELCVP